MHAAPLTLEGLLVDGRAVEWVAEAESLAFLDEQAATKRLVESLAPVGEH